jgi:hypothetical protein
MRVRMKEGNGEENKEVRLKKKKTKMGKNANWRK